MKTVAIIGSRNPTPKQLDAVLKRIQSLSDEDTVISGCADGVDAYALQKAHEYGINTIGCLPWSSYNPHVQKYCNHVVVTKSEPAFQSVRRHHPAPARLSQGAMKLHARNFDIIIDADEVLACPSNKPGGGGTGQGIRIAEHFDIPLEKVFP